jgi:hypothetical protein
MRVRVGVRIESDGWGLGEVSLVLRFLFLIGCSCSIFDQVINSAWDCFLREMLPVEPSAVLSCLVLRRLVVCLALSCLFLPCLASSSLILPGLVLPLLLFCCVVLY